MQKTAGRIFQAVGVRRQSYAMRSPKSLGMFRKGGVSKLGKWEERMLERQVGGQVMLDPSSHVKRYHCRGATYVNLQSPYSQIRTCLQGKDLNISFKEGTVHPITLTIRQKLF